MIPKEFPFLTQVFIDKTLGSGELISAEVIGADTGMVSCIAKIGVKQDDGTINFHVIKSFNSIFIPLDENSKELDPVEYVLRELSFYNELAPTLRNKYLNIPKLTGSIVEQNKIGVTERIILEFLDSPWKLGDQINGLTLEQGKSVMKSLARFHSFPIESVQDKKWLSKTDSKHDNGFLHSLYPYLKTCFIKILPFLDEKIEFTQEDEKKMKENIENQVSDIPVDKVIFVLSKLWKYMDQILVPFYECSPLCLVHHDVRGDNIFFSNNDDGSSNCMFVDWQNISYGPDIIDITYFISTSFTIEDRRKYEYQLLECYMEEYLCFNENPAPENTLDSLIKRYEISHVYPLLWCCSLCGIDSLLDGFNKTDPAVRERATICFLESSKRYLQAAIDHESWDKFEALL